MVEAEQEEAFVALELGLPQTPYLGSTAELVATYRSIDGSYATDLSAMVR